MTNRLCCLDVATQVLSLRDYCCAPDRNCVMLVDRSVVEFLPCCDDPPELCRCYPNSQETVDFFSGDDATIGMFLRRFPGVRTHSFDVRHNKSTYTLDLNTESRKYRRSGTSVEGYLLSDTQLDGWKRVKLGRCDLGIMIYE